MKIFDPNRRGGLSLEMLGILVIMGLFIGFAARRFDVNREQAKATMLVNQLNLANKGAQNFLDANSALLLAELKDRGYIIADADGVWDQGDTAVDLGEGQGSQVLAPYFPVQFKKTKAQTPQRGTPPLPPKSRLRGPRIPRSDAFGGDSLGGRAP